MSASRTFRRGEHEMLAFAFCATKVHESHETTSSRSRATTERPPPPPWRRRYPPRISDGSDTSSLGVMTGTAAPGSTLDIEGDGVKDAIEKLQKALTPSVVLDRELDARRDDAVRVASGGAYKSPYHDAHHATIVAASALLGRALGEGGVGTGFVYGAETMVRDALLMIDGAARDALRWLCTTAGRDRIDMRCRDACRLVMQRWAG